VGDIEPPAPQVFVSYSHRDKKWLDRLQVHLAPLLQNGAVTVWSDNRIRPGQEWKTEIESAMASARVAVLLVTSDFLASDFIQKNELPPLLEAAQAKGLTILWVAVSASLYEEARFAKYQAVNDPSQPLNSLPKAKRESELVQIARRVKEAVAVTSQSALKKKMVSS
jgi:internalin A